MRSTIMHLSWLSAACALPLAATITVTLSPDLPSPQTVGTSIRWTATVTDTEPGGHKYRFNTQPTGLPEQIKKDFSEENFWVWTPTGYEDTVRVIVIVYNTLTGSYNYALANYVLTSRVSGGASAANPTAHPLVAYFSAPACQAPNSMRVRFQQTGSPKSDTTNLQPCRAVVSSPAPNLKSMNFLVAGMYASSTYMMNWETVNPAGTLVQSGNKVAFQTGAIPASVVFPAYNVTVPPTGVVDQPLLLQTSSGSAYTSVATDLMGVPVWYHPRTNISADRTWFGGTQIVREALLLREIDLAGNTLLETNVARVSDQLVARGFPSISGFHHDARRIYAPGKPNHGYLMTLGYSSILSEQYQGGTPENPVEIMGDVVIVLDNNLQLSWAWSAFDKMDITRLAILGEKCTPTGTCPPRFLPVANDWTHSNSVQYNQWDGNIVVSVRHQDWLIKIKYADGAGNGDLVWRMGVGGDFTVTTNGTENTHDAAYPWFSHQHDGEFELLGAEFGGRKVLTVMDNGNTRRAQFNPAANTRCQSFAVDEAARTVNLNINFNQGVYAGSRGNAQLMTNGSLHCDAAAIQGPGGASTLSSENDKLHNLKYEIRWNTPVYRTFRMKDLYTPVTP